MFRVIFAASVASALPHALLSASIDINVSPQNGAEAALTLEACAPRAAGTGPSTTPDSADAFIINTAFSVFADTASTPKGYTQVFQDLSGSNIQLDSYLQFHYLTTYSTADCARACDETENCAAFNIYFERDPVVEPAAACPDPASTAAIKCALYNEAVDETSVINLGQFREEFEVVIAGSNGFVKIGGEIPETPEIPENPNMPGEGDSPDTPDTPDTPGSGSQPSSGQEPSNGEHPNEGSEPSDPTPSEPLNPGPEEPHPDLPSTNEPSSHNAPVYSLPEHGTAPKLPACPAKYHE
ncbi:uncharacterized protein RCC_05134 [Ramularia collo-cygni]|uniref:Apple domain-containing protein n=1 Tax=Ramularia collo-cygni TaxID=112498 RepID=A0A2D3UVI1_9PEZI|nr:uncharacterized protein RCC_05134 [Ramularia collo-cygni]CZT19288.1 uncharacterized protein RCC_05134 [Ramularia collo-cygni]